MMIICLLWLKILMYDKCLFYGLYLEKAFFKFVANDQFLQFCIFEFHPSPQGWLHLGLLHAKLLVGL